METNSRNRRIAGLAVVVIAVLMGGLAGSWATAKAGWTPFGGGESVPIRVSSAATSDIGKDVSFVNGFVPVVKQVLPAVVNIASSKVVRSPAQGQFPQFFSDPFFNQLFGDQLPSQPQAPQEQREHSLGSGVIVSPDGHILTNNHVVSGASEIKVSLPDNREFTAHVVGTDPKTDIAVLKIDAKDLPVVTFGDSSKMRVGDFAVAVGNPFGVGETVTMGIISATGRGGLGIEDYEDFIQTDAAVNPGNSGGALVNVNGELIAINTAIISGGGGNQGVGFAVPVNMARNVMEQIVEHGKVTRGWLGVSVQPLNAGIAKAFGLSGQPHGALVGDVTPDSPAAHSGLQKGDIILELNGEPVVDSRTLSLKISAMAPATTVQLKVWREAKELDMSVKLGELPATPDKAEENSGAGSGPKLGISVETLTPQVARQLGLPPSTTGIAVGDVQSGSVAQEAGLRQGDVIQEVNRKTVGSVDEFQNAVRQGGDQPVLLLIDRAGSHLYVIVQPR